jgi:hypothetical protein
MITRSREPDQFEDGLIRKNKPGYIENYKIVNALYEEAKALKIFPLDDPLDGIEADNKISQALYSLPKTT